MVAIPANTVTTEDLVEWNRLQEQLKTLRASEMLLRKRIFGAYFPAPVEGTNSAPLAAGWVLKGGHKIERKIDIGALTAMSARDANGHSRFSRAFINVDTLVKYTPELVMKEYRTLTEEQRKLFDSALIVSAGSPTLEIVLPAKAKPATTPTPAP